MGSLRDGENIEEKCRFSYGNGLGHMPWMTAEKQINRLESI